MSLRQRRGGETVDVISSEQSDVLTLAEAAAVLRVHPVTLRKRALKWGVPHKRLGSEWRFSRAVLLAWVKTQ